MILDVLLTKYCHQSIVKPFYDFGCPADKILIAEYIEAIIKKAKVIYDFGCPADKILIAEYIESNLWFWMSC